MALKAQRAARLIEVRFGPRVESTPHALVVTNQAAHILLITAQAERLFGYVRRDLIGEPLEMLLPERFRERYVAPGAAGATESESPPPGMVLELSGVRPHGTEFPAEVKTHPWRGKMVRSS